ncbi:Abi family protein [Nocardioides litoris]|uniref:Abi family protein n=1 Tax=Nocardioides litoris TaxID=1926648 RepID=UPI00111FE867|nr:Abi family protein [Nocardioides litoris]
MGRLHDLFLRLCVALLLPPRERERGDVPGWVLVTVMSAGIVGVLYSFAKPQLKGMLDAALSSVQ